jgi:zinc/manganese transport system ATP-binding protein
MSTNTSPPAIHVHNLRVALGGHPIIDNISFAVPPGKTTAIIGPNGAGKSVLIKALLHLIPKQSGVVEFFGVSHNQYRRVARRISYIPQSLSLEPSIPLTVTGLFMLTSSHLWGMSRADHNRMQELLDLVGFHDLHKAPLNTLSGGQLQRVFIAYSLMRQPELMILDEPSAGIDVSGQESIYSLLERIQNDHHITLLLVSHELDIVMRYANQVLCLNRQLLCAGAPHEVLSNDLLSKMYGSPVAHFKHSH